MYGAANSSKTASNHWFYAYKKFKNGNSARRTSTQSHVSLLNVTSGRPYAMAEVTISVREYPENYQK